MPAHYLYVEICDSIQINLRLKMHPKGVPTFKKEKKTMMIINIFRDWILVSKITNRNVYTIFREYIFTIHIAAEKAISEN